MLDPFRAEDSLRVLSRYTDTFGDCCRHVEAMLWGIDPVEMLDVRLKMIARLGRYGHTSMNSWEGEDVVDLVRKYEAVMEIIEKENALTAVRERA